MALPRAYAEDTCSAARALEVIGERWTLLIVRDAFLGVRRFGDFAAHLDIPRAVLSSRLKSLVNDGVLERVPSGGPHAEYRLTDKGTKLWPVVRSILAWGDEFYSPHGPRRLHRHDADGGALDPEGRCTVCGESVPVAEIITEPGPGFEAKRSLLRPELAGLREPRRLLEPLRSAEA